MKIRLQSKKPKPFENADAVRTTGCVSDTEEPHMVLSTVKEMIDDLNRHVETKIKFDFDYSSTSLDYKLTVTYNRR